MSAIKKLLSQTAIYGVSSIVARFLNFLLVPFYTRILNPAEYGIVTELYSYTGFLAVLLTFGFETGYFRFSKSNGETKVFSQAIAFLSFISFVFVAVVFFSRQLIGDALQYEQQTDFFVWFALILFLDTVSAIPFTRLRNEEKAFQFAGIKIIEIFVNIGLNIFFFIFCKNAYDNGSSSVLATLYSPSIGVGYIFIANLIASFVKFVLLLPVFKPLKLTIDRKLLLEMLRYSAPMIIIGLAGITNEMLDRVLLPRLLSGTITENREMVGIYAACYKISIILSLFIQAFRFAAEPFFFSHASDKNSPQLFAKVMDIFVVFCCIVFLGVGLNLDIVKYFVGEKFWGALGIVPILMMANVFLGIYVNLSIWYKLSDKTMMGAWVAIFGALITITLNIWWIPIFGYVGSAWATLICYAFMAIVSYILGQKFYPIPYHVKKISIYLLTAVAMLVVFGLLPTVSVYLQKVMMLAFIGLYFCIVYYFEKATIRSLIKR